PRGRDGDRTPLRGRRAQARRWPRRARGRPRARRRARGAARRRQLPRYALAAALAPRADGELARALQHAHLPAPPPALTGLLRRRPRRLPPDAGAGRRRLRAARAHRPAQRRRVGVDLRPARRGLAALAARAPAAPRRALPLAARPAPRRARRDAALRGEPL